MMLWIGLALTLTIILLVVWLAKRGTPYTLDTLGFAVNSLLRRGYDGGFLTINISFSPKFVQLRKYIRGPGDYGIELAFPKARWSERYFDQVAAVCGNQSVEYTIEKEDPGRPMEFLYANFERDDRAATACVRAILEEVFDVTGKQKLFCMMGNAAFEDVLIDGPR